MFIFWVKVFARPNRIDYGLLSVVGRRRRVGKMFQLSASYGNYCFT